LKFLSTDALALGFVIVVISRSKFWYASWCIPICLGDEQWYITLTNWSENWDMTQFGLLCGLWVPQFSSASNLTETANSFGSL